MKITTVPLKPGVYYHIYNRGNNRENLFREERNYFYFLRLYREHIDPIADTYAYCLMRNHFHISLEIKETSQVLTPRAISQKFSNFFNAYAKTINKAYDRTGSLFEERFGRIPVTSTSYFENLIRYIHFNPQKHGFVTNFRDWCWSSYHELLGHGPTILKRENVLERFGGRHGFETFHRGESDDGKLSRFIDDEFDRETDL